ncbi:glycosyltransferase [Rhodobacterales bacterium LSUCC0031]|nr:glycosyltransferase [Rhodobacterales bacterium LSUCC0031]
MTPKVSVVLPVYNGTLYLRESIDSILAQSFTDFELLVLNDGSSDASGAIAQSYVDSRIRYIEHRNMGLAATLNKGVSLAKGEFIVRQDQDDVSLPTRVARQVEYLERHPEVAVLGTWATVVNAEGQPDGRKHRHPVGNAALRVETLFDSAFVHSSVTMRRDALLATGGYTTDRTRQPPEDYELWSRLLRTHLASNIPEPLLLYREVASSMSRTMKTDFFERVIRISAENLLYWSGAADAEAEKVALFAARLIHAGNVPHDHSVSLAAVRSLFDAACEGIARAGGGLDEDANRRCARLRFSLARAWSVGRCRTEWGRWLARAAWKIARL